AMVSIEILYFLSMCMRSSIFSKVSSIVRFVFFLEKVSLAVILRTPSKLNLFVCIALSIPFAFKYKAWYCVLELFLNPLAISSASDILGTHFGLTKEVTSIIGILHSESMSIIRILSSVETGVSSICIPSLGPTSRIITWLGKFTFLLLRLLQIILLF